MTDEAIELEVQKFRAKKKRAIERRIGEIAQVVRSWFLATALEYMKDKKLKNSEEDFLERFTDFYLDELDRIEAENV